MLGITAKLKCWYCRRKYRVGTTLSRFLAPDIRRDVQVLDASQLDDGFITVKVRTWNVLYALNGIDEEPAFGEPVCVSLDSLWTWSGESWGGPIPPESWMSDDSG